jgi:hypothetical protein
LNCELWWLFCGVMAIMLIYMAKLLEKLRDACLERIWRLDSRTLTPVRRMAVYMVRLVHNQMEPLLRHFFEPLGNKGIEYGQPILEILIKHALVCESGDEPPTYFPARDIDTIRLASIINRSHSP